MSRTTAVINFSASQQLARLITIQAKKEHKTKSELLRDAFNAYMFDQQLKSIQQTGRVIAQKLGLDSYDEIEEYLST